MNSTMEGRRHIQQLLLKKLPNNSNSLELAFRESAWRCGDYFKFFASFALKINYLNWRIIIW